MRSLDRIDSHLFYPSEIRWSNRVSRRRAQSSAQDEEVRLSRSRSSRVVAQSRLGARATRPCWVQVLLVIDWARNAEAQSRYVKPPSSLLPLVPAIPTAVSVKHVLQPNRLRCSQPPTPSTHSVQGRETGWQRGIDTRLCTAARTPPAARWCLHPAAPSVAILRLAQPARRPAIQRTNVRASRSGLKPVGRGTISGAGSAASGRLPRPERPDRAAKICRSGVLRLLTISR